jgi:hypothetical protein
VEQFSLRHHRDECDNHGQSPIHGKVPKPRCRNQPYFAHISNEQEDNCRKFKSFLLFQGSMERIALRQRARRMFAVTLNFHFLCVIGIRTVVAAIGVDIGNVTPALLIRAFVLSTHIENFRHYPPQRSDFCFDLS